MNSYEQPQPNDIRFQFEIIKGLGESVRLQTTALANLQKGQLDIVERLARIEARDHAEALATLRVEVDALKADKQRRDGASGIVHAILKSPVLAWVVAIAGFIWYEITGKAK